MKKQRTRWIYWAQYLCGQYIKVGYIYNKKGIKDDKIRLRIVGEHGIQDLNMRKEEALCIANGLLKVVTKMEVENLKG